MKATNLGSRVLQLQRAAGGGGVVGAGGGIVGPGGGGIVGGAGVPPGGGWAYSVTLQRAFIAAAPAASGDGVERGAAAAAALPQPAAPQLFESGVWTPCAATGV
jgi:hypothetical protein